MTIGMFSLGLPIVPVYICAFLFSCVGGLVPSAVMGSVPFHAPTGRLIPATNGLLVQGSNLGIVLGPPFLSGIATVMGWRWVPLLTILAAALATLLAAALHANAHSRKEVWTGVSGH
jgi:MFS family permease